MQGSATAKISSFFSPASDSHQPWPQTNSPMRRYMPLARRFRRPRREPITIRLRAWSSPSSSIAGRFWCGSVSSPRMIAAAACARILVSSARRNRIPDIRHNIHFLNRVAPATPLVHGPSLAESARRPRNLTCIQGNVKRFGYTFPVIIKECGN